MEKITLNVEGMSCSHCENAVKNAVGELDGVSNVAVNLAEKTVTIDFDAAKVSPAEFKPVIEEEGFDVV